MEKPRLSFGQIWNMSFGFLGIQFGWGLQMANMSPIYEYLGAKPDQIPMLWLAAPLTGLLVQPIIGHMSDRTWTRPGRRRPYFLPGALLASFALLAMPHSSTLWMAAGLLWIMDASINISMEPFRAFVADLLPPEQRTRGYAMQALFIGLGAVIASMLPWLLYSFFPAGSDGGVPGKTIPFAVRRAFYLGAFAYLAAVLWTIVTTREHPPADLEAFRRAEAEKGRLGRAVAASFPDRLTQPPPLPRLAPAEVFSPPGFLLYVALLRGGRRAERLRRHSRHASLRTGHRLGGQLLRHVFRRVLRLFVRAAGRGRVAGPPARPWPVSPDGGHRPRLGGRHR